MHRVNDLAMSVSLAPPIVPDERFPWKSGSHRSGILGIETSM